jgi:Fe-S cluster biogenesis protein NfuA
MLNVAYFEPTPNPNAFKFHTGTPLLKNGQSLSFSKKDNVNALPLAQQLFGLGDVEAVLVAEDFVSVSGTPTANWPQIKAQVEESLKNYDIDSASELAQQRAAENAESKKSAAENPLFQKVDDLFEQYVRPALAGDGGGIELVEVEDKVVRVRYQGACGSCPTSTASTMMAIENLLRDKIDPELSVEPAY